MHQSVNDKPLVPLTDCFHKMLPGKCRLHLLLCNTPWFDRMPAHASAVTRRVMHLVATLVRAPIGITVSAELVSQYYCLAGLLHTCVASLLSHHASLQRPDGLCRCGTLFLLITVALRAGSRHRMGAVGQGVARALHGAGPSPLSESWPCSNPVQLQLHVHLIARPPSWPGSQLEIMIGKCSRDAGESAPARDNTDMFVLDYLTCPAGASSSLKPEARKHTGCGGSVARCTL